MPLDTPPEFVPPAPPVPAQAVPVPPDMDLVGLRPDPGSPLSTQASVSVAPARTAPVSSINRSPVPFWMRGLTVGAASFPLIAVGGSALAQDAGVVDSVGGVPGTWIHVAASGIQMLLFLGMRWLDQRGNDYNRVLAQLDETSRRLAQTAEDLAETRMTLRVTEVEMRQVKDRLAEEQKKLVDTTTELRDAREALLHDGISRDNER